jgi:uncharacterized OsmC-like protein
MVTTESRVKAARRVGRDGLALGQDASARRRPQTASVARTYTAPTPHELLAATLASCVSTMIVLYAQRPGWDLGDLHVAVDYDADSTLSEVRITVRVPMA